MALVSDVPQMEEQFRRTLFTQTVQSIPMSKTEKVLAGLHCYLVTPSDFVTDNIFRNDYVLLSCSSNTSSTIDNQFNFISFSQAMFSNAKALDGGDLVALNETYSALFSNTPTRL
jgi:hypothetical protein